MSKYKIAFFDSGGRSMFKEALPSHPSVEEVHWVSGYSKAGVSTNPKTFSWERIIERLKDYDLIFTIQGRHFWPHGKQHVTDSPMFRLFNTIEREKLWKKTIIWDYNNDPSIWQPALDKCLAYFKKAWAWDKQEPPPKLYVLDYNVLDLYIDMIPNDLYNRDIDVGYFFGFRGGTGMRRNVWKHIKNTDWGQMHLETSYTTGQMESGHNLYQSSVPLLPDGRLNWWYVYMHFLRRCKVLFTTTDWYEGDVRTGEAYASGALVFIGKTGIPSPMPPFEHGKHLFIFDPRNDNSIEEAIALAKHYLKPENEEKRKQIAKAGWEHACKYYRSSNYIDYVMKIVEKHLNERKG